MKNNTKSTQINSLHDYDSIDIIISTTCHTKILIFFFRPVIYSSSYYNYIPIYLQLSSPQCCSFSSFLSKTYSLGKVAIEIHHFGREIGLIRNIQQYLSVDIQKYRVFLSTLHPHDVIKMLYVSTL